MSIKELQKFVLVGVIVVSSSFCYTAEMVKSDVSAAESMGDLAWVEQYNVVWTSQSKNSSESMPVSGGDIGLNVWVENDELLLYMGRAGCRDENGALLKPGRIRIGLTPNPFKNGKFRQELKLREGYMLITARQPDGNNLAIKVWVEVARPIIHLDIKSENPVMVEATYESWRTETIELPNDPSKHDRRAMCMINYDAYPGKVFLYKDEIRANEKLVRFHHRVNNTKDCFNFQVIQQELELVRDQMVNPLENLVWGGALVGDNFTLTGQTSGKYAECPFKDFKYVSKTAVRSHRLRACLHIDQVEKQDAWYTALQELIDLSPQDDEKAWDENQEWWADFWNRSRLVINSGRGEQDVGWRLGRNYQLFRYMLASNVNGREPTLFNGGLFTFDPLYVNGKKGPGYTPDHRQWGAAFTAQNQRLVYRPMLKTGDFDLMPSGFSFYLNGLPNAMARVRHYWKHDGCCFEEQSAITGLPGACQYGFFEGGRRGRPKNFEVGIQVNRAGGKVYEEQLDWSWLILQYHQSSGADIARYLPLIEQSVIFYDEHYRYRCEKLSGKELDGNGKLVIFPANTLEGHWDARNPTSVIAGLRRVLTELINLPERYTPVEKRERWRGILERLPEMPTASSDRFGGRYLKPAENYDHQSWHCPEMFPLFPYELYGLGLPDLDLMKRTSLSTGKDRYKTISWEQANIHAPRLGETELAQKLNSRKMDNGPYRFPAFWPHTIDWTPDHNWGGSGMIGMQEMVMQTHAGKIRILPAWTKHWDVDFKLHAPHMTTLECSIRNGEIVDMKVSPASRRRDVVTDWHTRTYRADLPDAMTFLDGRKVKTAHAWEARKAEIKRLWCDTFIGHTPKEIPALLSAEVVKTKEPRDGSTRQRIVLTFDTPNKKSFEIEMWEPKAQTATARPLLMTQPRNYQREMWGEEALKRGYVVCIYPGLDAHHSEKDYPGYQNVWKQFKNEYPDATWNSSLGIQAWLASRTLDYLLDPKYGRKIDPEAVGITGFSRYGKQSIYAAAFDERFTCVAARSSGTPTACSYRFAARQTFMESVSLEDCPKVWLIDKARTFHGRENELPVEGNALMACIAPRHLLLDTAYNDGSDPTFGVEHSYLNAKKAWTFLGRPENICLSYRKGNHGPVTDEQVKHNLDFFDTAFGRGRATASDFPELLIHAFDWQAWKAKQRVSDLSMPEQASVRRKIGWMLGEQPVSIKGAGTYHIKTGDELGVPDWSRDRWNPGGIKRVPFSFSGKMHGNIFFDPERETYKATVIWLHPWNYSHGSNEGYGVQGTTIYYRLAKEGYKVVMYDQFGFGDHLNDAVGFYDTYPHWSRMGRAVYDVQKVIDFLVDGKGITAQPVPPTDPDKIYICGFAYGGMVGLYATALDERIAGLACFSGFTPMRTDTDAKPTGGIRQYWQWHALMPKLGLYHGKESTIPFDYDDVLALIAPRKCLIYAPTRDRFADSEDVKACIMKTKALWQDEDALTFVSPDDICRFQREQQDALVRWFEATVAKGDHAVIISKDES